jgi:hypothetical protein
MKKLILITTLTWGYLACAQAVTGQRLGWMHSGLDTQSPPQTHVADAFTIYYGASGATINPIVISNPAAIKDLTTGEYRQLLMSNPSLANKYNCFAVTASYNITYVSGGVNVTQMVESDKSPETCGIISTKPGNPNTPRVF